MERKLPIQKLHSLSNVERTEVTMVARKMLSGYATFAFWIVAVCLLINEGTLVSAKGGGGGGGRGGGGGGGGGGRPSGGSTGGSRPSGGSPSVGGGSRPSGGSSIGGSRPSGGSSGGTIGGGSIGSKPSSGFGGGSRPSSSFGTGRIKPSSSGTKGAVVGVAAGLATGYAASSLIHNSRRPLYYGVSPYSYGHYYDNHYYWVGNRYYPGPAANKIKCIIRTTHDFNVTYNDTGATVTELIFECDKGDRCCNETCCSEVNQTIILPAAPIWTNVTFPNPCISLVACGMGNQTDAFICDPDSLVPESRRELNEHFKNAGQGDRIYAAFSSVSDFRELAESLFANWSIECPKHGRPEPVGLLFANFPSSTPRSEIFWGQVDTVLIMKKNGTNDTYMPIIPDTSADEIGDRYLQIADALNATWDGREWNELTVASTPPSSKSGASSVFEFNLLLLVSSLVVRLLGS